MEEDFCKNCGTFGQLCDSGLCCACADDIVEKINNQSSESEDSMCEFDDDKNRLFNNDSEVMSIQASWRERGPQKTNHLASDQIIPYKYEGKGKPTDCAICMDVVSAGQEVVTLPCAHTFHSICIIHWLNQNEVCPICRTSVVSGQNNH